MPTRKELQAMSAAYYDEARTKERNERINNFVLALTKHIVNSAESGKTSVNLKLVDVYPSNKIISYIDIPYYLCDEIIERLKNNFPDVDFTLEKALCFEELHVCWE